MKTIILLSGGLDSTTLLYKLHSDECHLHAVLVDYKQAHVQELQFAKAHCHKLGIRFTTLSVPELGGMSATDPVVPNRNMVLISLAVNVAVREGCERIVIGCNADDHTTFPDCREPFIDAMEAAVQAAGYSITVVAPFVDTPKWQIGALAQDLGVDTSLIWTCYKGGKEPCGECMACKKLAEALDHK